MRHLLRFGLFIAAITAAVVVASPTLRAQDVPYEREMWPNENRFVAAFIAGDIEALGGMWHDDLSYWPAGEDRPWGKRYALKQFNKWSGAENGKLSTPMLEPMAAKVMGDTAVAHYRLEYTIANANGDRATRQLRLTHTWSKVDGNWKLLGGSNTEITD